MRRQFLDFADDVVCGNPWRHRQRLARHLALEREKEAFLSGLRSQDSGPRPQVRELGGLRASLLREVLGDDLETPSCVRRMRGSCIRWSIFEEMEVLRY